MRIFHHGNTDSQVYVYDPSYEAPPSPTTRRNLKSLPLVGAKAYKMITELRNKRGLAIEEVFVGGGGNLEGDCRKMSLQWIRGGVEQMVTAEDWKQRVEWERVNLA